MKNFEIYKDNAGGIALFTFDENGTVDFFDCGYEREEGSLLATLQSLKNGKLDFDESVFDELYDVTLQEMYDEYSSSDEVESPVLIADTEGIYPYHSSEYMLPELGINKDDFWDNIYDKYVEENPIKITDDKRTAILTERNRPFPWNYLNVPGFTDNERQSANAALSEHSDKKNTISKPEKKPSVLDDIKNIKSEQSKEQKSEPVQSQKKARSNEAEI